MQAAEFVRVNAMDGTPDELTFGDFERVIRKMLFGAGQLYYSFQRFESIFISLLYVDRQGFDEIEREIWGGGVEYTHA